ncbi:MAG: T9SS type A sorting domain-containing protein [Bacteroidota bacterium]
MKKTLLSLVVGVAMTMSATAQINVTGPIPFDNIMGGTVAPIFQGSAGTTEMSPGVQIPKITGSLTGVTMDAILTASTNDTYANDLTILVTSGPDLSQAANYLLQVGGFSNFVPANKFAWGCEPACDVATLSTPVTGTVNSFAAMDFTGSTMIIWLANGYVDADPATNSGSWTINSMSFAGVTQVVGINEASISSSVYPNPANDVLNIKMDQEVASVEVLSLDGKVVATSTTASVNVTDLNSGMYIYRVMTASGAIATGTFAKN